MLEEISISHKELALPYLKQGAEKILRDWFQGKAAHEIRGRIGIYFLNNLIEHYPAKMIGSTLFQRCIQSLIKLTASPNLYCVQAAVFSLGVACHDSWVDGENLYLPYTIYIFRAFNYILKDGWADQQK